MDIQSIAAVAGFLVGVAYVIGGLIVNIHLSRYGITEYGILRISYLVVGLVYFVSFAAISILAVIFTLVLTVFFQMLIVNPNWILVISLVILFLFSILRMRKIIKDPFYYL